MIVKAGNFLGPFKSGLKKYYVHQRCALWSPKVVLEPITDKLKGVLEEIKRSNSDVCTYCSQKGGGIGCSVKRCQNGYHYLCARSAQCVFDWTTYLIYCPDHAYKCEQVGQVVTNDLQDQKIDTFVESNSYSCYIRKSGLDVNTMVDCDKCNLTIHGYCNEPEIPDVSLLPDPWYCFKCSANNHNKIEKD